MTCPNCGAQNPDGKRFCANCGIALSTASPVASTGAPAPSGVTRNSGAAQPARQNPPVAAAPKRGRGCLGWGCLIILSFLAIVIVVGGVGAALYFQVPVRLGLAQSPSQRLLSGPPDRAAASAIKDDLAKAGIDTTGMTVSVLPIAGTDGSLVAADLDASKGFNFKTTQGTDPIIDYMTRLTTSGPAKAAGVKRVVLTYHDKSGTSLMTLTAPTDAISGFASGSLNRQEFLKKVDGSANWPAFYQEQYK